MNIIKKFIHYYNPYKAVFFIDLICAAVISLQDTLSGIRVVQSFANEEIEHEKFRKSNEAFLVSKRDNYHCMGSFMSSNLFFQVIFLPENL